MEPDDIPLPQTIGDYNSRCRSHQDDPLFLFDNFVKLQLELVTVISFYILSKVKSVLTSVKNIQNEDFAKVSSNYALLKTKKNEHFLASNAIDFGKKTWKILNNRLYLEEKKHIIMQKLDGPLKSLARVSIYNSNFAKAQ